MVILASNANDNNAASNQEASPYHNVPSDSFKSKEGEEGKEPIEVVTLRSYFDTLQGSSSQNHFVQVVLPYFEKVFDTDIVFSIGEDTNLDYPQLECLVQTFCSKHGTAVIESLEYDTEHRTVSAVIQNTLPGEATERSHQTYYFNENGKMIRGSVSPQDSIAFENLVARTLSN